MEFYKLPGRLVNAVHVGSKMLQSIAEVCSSRSDCLFVTSFVCVIYKVVKTKAKPVGNLTRHNSSKKTSTTVIKQAGWMGPLLTSANGYKARNHYQKVLIFTNKL